ncbi:MAG TPA: DUF2147 domain-containing protein [Stellaceae bacterium]|nr:DUF2147 domain-containing protein [Stellaceae bacterium]
MSDLAWQIPRLTLWAALSVAGVACLLPAPAAHGAEATSVAGLWLVEAKDAVVDIEPCGDKLCGTVVWLKQPRRRDGSVRLDDKNPDAELRSRPVCGLELMNGFKSAGPNERKDGHIYSADEGATYSAKMALTDPNTLKVRGFIGISLFGKSQIWTRAPDDAARCTAS